MFKLFERLLGKPRNAYAEYEALLADKTRIEQERRRIIPRMQDREEWAHFYSSALRILEDDRIHPAARLLILSEEDSLVNEMLYQLNQSPIENALVQDVHANVQAKLKEEIRKLKELRAGTIAAISKQEKSEFFHRLKKAREDVEMQRLSFDGINGKLNGPALMKKRLSILTNPAIDIAGKLMWVESEEAQQLKERYFSLLNELTEAHTERKEQEFHETQVAIDTLIAHEIHSAQVASGSESPEKSRVYER